MAPHGDWPTGIAALLEGSHDAHRLDIDHDQDIVSYAASESNP